MQAVQLLQLNNDFSTQDNASPQSINETESDRSFMMELKNAASQQNKEKVDSSRGSSLKLSKEEIAKVKKLLTEEGVDLSEEELKELLDSIGNIYQQLLQLDVDQLSFESPAEKKEFKTLKAELIKTLEAFKAELQNLKDVDSEKLKLYQKFGSDLKSINSQQKIKDIKQLQQQKNNLLMRLAKLKKIAGEMQQQKVSSLSKDNQQSQQVSKLFNQLTGLDNKLNELLHKYGITEEQIEFKQKKDNQLKFNGHKANQSTKDKVVNPKEESNSTNKKEAGKSSSEKSLLKQLSDSKNKDVSKHKLTAKLADNEQKLKAENAKTNKLTAEDQMRAKNNLVRQNIINSKFVNINGEIQRVDQTKVVNQVLQQLEQLKSLGKNELTLKLKPDFLGKVNLKMAISDGVLTTKVMAESYQVKKAIEGQLYQLKNALAEKNLEVGEMIVEVGSEEDFSSFQEQEPFSQQEFSSRQQNRQSQELDPELLMELGEIEELIEVDSTAANDLAVDSIDYVI